MVLGPDTAGTAGEWPQHTAGPPAAGEFHSEGRLEPSHEPGGKQVSSVLPVGFGNSTARRASGAGKGPRAFCKCTLVSYWIWDCWALRHLPILISSLILLLPGSEQLSPSNAWLATSPVVRLQGGVSSVIKCPSGSDWCQCLLS